MINIVWVGFWKAEAELRIITIWREEVPVEHRDAENVLVQIFHRECQLCKYE